MSNFDKLKEWIRDNKGFVHPNLILKKNKLETGEKIGAPGVQLFVIPKNLCLDEGIYKNYKAPGLLHLTYEEQGIYNLPFFKLILNLISEKLKGNASFYKPLIASLPKMDELVNQNPIFYYNDKKEDWKKILPTVITKLDNINNFYINLYVVINKIEVFKRSIDLKMFPRYQNQDEILRTIVLWAFLIINIYAIDKEYLMPLYNFLHYNHETSNQLVLENDRINFSYNSIDTLQLVINNGILDNETLFTLHGYMNKNEKKFMEIQIINTKAMVENEDVKRVIKDTFKDLYDKDKQKYYITEDTPSIHLVQYLRILSLNNRDLQFVEGDNIYFTKFISMDNEAGVYQKLLKIIQVKYKLIKKYNEIKHKDDSNDIVLLRTILKEQKDILKNMYFEIHKKWLKIMETEIDDKKLQDLFKLE